MIDLEVPVEGVALDALDAFLSSDRSPSDSAALIFDSGRRVIAKTPLDDPRLPRPRPSPVAPRIVRSERGLARCLAKEDRPLRIAPRFFDRDETPAIFVRSLVFDQSQVVCHVERKYYRRRRAAWPFAAVNLPFRLARTASRMLAGNWSTEILISGDPKQ